MSRLGGQLSQKNVIYGDRRIIVKRLFGYIFQYKGLTICALIFTLVGNILAMYGPKLAGNAINLIELGTNKIDLNMVYYYCCLMIIFYSTSFLFNYVLRKIMVHLSQSIIYKIRKESFQKISKLEVGYFDSHQIGDILSRFLYDAETLGMALCQDFIIISTSCITAIMSIIMLLSISPLMFVFWGFMIPISAMITTLINKRVRPMFRNRTQKLGNLNGFFEEIVSGYKTVKVYNQQKNIEKQFENFHEEVLDAHYKSEYYSTMVSPCVNFINNLSLAILCITGSILYLIAKISLGEISSFILYSKKFSGVLNEISTISNEIQSALAAAERIFNFIDEKEEEDSPNSIYTKKIDGDIKFSKVSFGYTNKEIIINNLNLNIKRGQMVAIVGKTGSGKSTLINLLMRFYKVSSGFITVDDKNINEISMESLRRSYALILQDTWFFHGTIYDNLVYGNPLVTIEEVENATKAIGVHNYIMSLKEGYNTILSEDAINISQGQKQLIAIARAMLVEANVLILDEATSNIDTITEIKIQKAIQKLMKNKTCFVIAHRLSTIKNADIILVMEQGSIVEKGTHDKLISQKGVYYSLYQSQFQ